MHFVFSRRQFAALAFAAAFALPATALARDAYVPAAADSIHAVSAEHGLVVAQEKIAADIGADILKQGGNAVDAAVATGFAMAVTYPRAGNIGGGGFMVIHLADRNQDIAIDYRETGPAAMTTDIFLGANGKPDNAKSRDSALGIGVPGTVAGLTLALEKYGSGKFTLAQILKPSIELARDGFVLTDDMADTLPQWYPRLAKWPASAKIFARADGKPLQEGDTLVQSDLAATLAAVAEQGPHGFYEGPVAEKLAKAIHDAGGIMTVDDLKSYQPVVRAPVRGTYRGYDIVSMPLPSSGGTVLLETLNILEGFRLADLEQGSAASLHLLIEAMKRAYADRARYLGDPAFVNAPTNILLAKDYATKLRAEIDPEHATPADKVTAALPPREGSNTTHYSVVDSQGNAVGQHLYAELLLWRRHGGGRNRRAAQQRARRFHCRGRRLQRVRAGRLRGQPARPRQTAAVLDVADHRAEGRQAGAGDGLARRQPHHFDGAAGGRECARLPHGRRGRCRSTPAAPSMATR